MKRTDQITGRRLPDVEFGEQYDRLKASQPGDFWKLLDDPRPRQASNLTGDSWEVVTPNGLHGCLLNHTVRENADGSITVAPGDGSSNSILVNGGDAGSWHGYITDGLWWELT